MRELMPKFGTAAAVALAVGLTLPSRAIAQPTDGAAAQVLFDQARDLASRGDYPQACPKFEASLRLDPALGTRMNLADCYEASGKLASAWAMFKAAADVARIQRDKREALASARAAKLEPRLPRLVVRVEGPPVPDMTIVRSGAAIEPAMLGTATFVDPGRMVITASAVGYKSQNITVDAKEGEVAEVVIPPLERAASGPAGAPSKPVVQVRPPASAPGNVEPAPPSPAVSHRRRTGLVIGGSGLVVAGVGLAVGISARSAWQDAFDGGGCNKVDLTCTSAGQERADAARTRATVSTVMVGVGAVAVGVGVYLFLTAPSPREERPRSAVRWVPVVGGGTSGLALTGDF